MGVTAQPQSGGPDTSALPHASTPIADDAAALRHLVAARERLTTELAKTIVGQQEVLEQLLVALFCRGHALVVGVPGLAKTLIVQSIGQALSLSFKRIQFTPDLMPADITGTEIIQQTADGQREFVFVPGPLFANLVLADEINRAPPKTQAALLEAMQEQQVTTGGKTRALPDPFFVLATQNPIEQEGTYPLPEAQQDRFMFEIHIDYPADREELEIIKRTTSTDGNELEPVLDGESLRAGQALVRRVPVPDQTYDYALGLVRATRPGDPTAPAFVREWLDWGAGPRAAQFLVLGAKARAALQGRPFASQADVRAVAAPVLRPRLIPNYQAESQGISREMIIARLLELG
ncbi:MoxR family ATPase [bacterium]|nr:MoxR family ATPase [bacterium]